MHEAEKYIIDLARKKKILSYNRIKDKINDKSLERILSFRPRIEKVAIKDAKLRTFITDDVNRDELVKHVYERLLMDRSKKKQTTLL